MLQVDPVYTQSQLDEAVRAAVEAEMAAFLKVAEPFEEARAFAKTQVNPKGATLGAYGAIAASALFGESYRRLAQFAAAIRARGETK